MGRTMLCTLGLTLALVGVSGCIEDDSVPNRRGHERPALLPTSDKDKENAEHRANEAPKRELPSDAGKEFPGQTRANPSAEPQTLFLAVRIGGVNAPPASTAPACPMCDAPAAKPAAPVAAPAAVPAVESVGSVPMLDETKAWAQRGAVMAVPGTGESIPADWGTVPPLMEYAHRPWSKGETVFVSGGVKHNPYYMSNLFDHPQYPDAPPIVQLHQGLGEVVWFYGEVLALPAFMLFEPPLIQRSTRAEGTDPVYHGQVPAKGAIVPAPLPGTIKWEYPFSNSQSVPESQASSIPSPLETPGVTPATQPAGK